MVYLMFNMLFVDDYQRDMLWKIRIWVEQFRNIFFEILFKFNYVVDKIMMY